MTTSTLPARATRYNAHLFINARADFQTGGALSGHTSAPLSAGELPSRWRNVWFDVRDRVVYVAKSYDTPIYWVLDDGTTYRPNVRYSNTTSHHQGSCPRGISVVPGDVVLHKTPDQTRRSRWAVERAGADGVVLTRLGHADTDTVLIIEPLDVVGFHPDYATPA